MQTYIEIESKLEKNICTTFLQEHGAYEDVLKYQLKKKTENILFPNYRNLITLKPQLVALFSPKTFKTQMFGALEFNILLGLPKVRRFGKEIRWILVVNYFSKIFSFPITNSCVHENGNSEHLQFLKIF